MFADNESLTREIKQFIDRSLVTYGHTQFAYLLLNKKNPSDIIIISNYPDEWVTLYKEHHYQHIDPVVISALRRVSPFLWDEKITVNSKLNLSKIFNLSKKYQVSRGYTFVLHDADNQLAMLSLMVDDRGLAEIERSRGVLQMLLIDAHERFMNGQRHITAQHYCSKKEPIENIFSTRENEILYWASMGKTYQEIALILGIKTGTVKFHIGNVVKKLGVLNAKHAIRLGVELQLIKPIEG
ncbi:LuxR family transcriptional regulator [Edwardsiella piscicida]|uniref:LuxR family transcriptional regulator n=1 Tax=Edwardsiella piscicida TaxID=1263550 RepID=UPI00291086F1|nr:LuxR family transcriptional regulator [Edwardsiella piscicida]